MGRVCGPCHLLFFSTVMGNICLSAHMTLLFASHQSFSVSLDTALWQIGKFAMEGSNFKWQSQAFFPRVSLSHIFFSNTFFIMCVMYAVCKGGLLTEKEWAVSASARCYPLCCFNILKQTLKSYHLFFHSLSHQVHKIYLTWSVQCPFSLLSWKDPLFVHRVHQLHELFIINTQLFSFQMPPKCLLTHQLFHTLTFVD